MRIFGCRYLTPDWKCNYECPAGYWESGTEEIGGTCELLTSKRGDVSLDSGPTLGDQRGLTATLVCTMAYCISTKVFRIFGEVSEQTRDI